jgi:putative SOS response-associated peptidase YedK
VGAGRPTSGKVRGGSFSGHVTNTIQTRAEGRRAQRRLVPSWWKRTVEDVPSTFNARAESVADKPMFRLAFKGNRCIVPASGYFEWKTIARTLKPG